MKILIITDAWRPQVNGVVRTLEATIEQAKQAGHEVVVLSHDWPGLNSFGLPTYKEIRLVWNVWKVGSIIKNIKPDAIHIATEGTLGVAAGTFCRHKKIPFTTSYHTKTPEYIKERFPWVPLSWGYRFMRWHHKGSRSCLVTTPSMKEELDAWSLHPNLQVWTRGVDYNTFDWRVAALPNNDIPVLTYVGRVAVEKNIEAFLNLPHEGFIKQVIGDGPDLSRLKEEYQHPNIRFLGYKFGTDLAREIAKSDCFVFPSKTDTFGIVMIEANACGCPVAAYPVTGPKDFVVNGINGYLDEDLYTAVANCLALDRRKVYEYVRENYSWEKTAHIFLDTLVPISIRWTNVTLP